MTLDEFEVIGNFFRRENLTDIIGKKSEEPLKEVGISQSMTGHDISIYYSIRYSFKIFIPCSPLWQIYEVGQTAIA